MWTDFQNSFYQFICKEILYVYIAQISTSPAVRCYTTKSKKLLILTASSTNC